MQHLKTTLLILLLSLTHFYIPVLPHLYSRIKLLHQNIRYNHPSVLKGPKGWITENGKYQVKYKEQLRYCEDLVLDERAGYAVLSCDKGRDEWNTVMGIFSPTPPSASGSLHIYDYSRQPPSLEPLRLLSLPPNHSFHPLGLSLHLPTSTLTVINHQLSGYTLDIFHLSRHGNSATYIRSLSSPLFWSPNAVVQIGDKDLLLTNDHFFTPKKHPWLNKLETYLALPLGSVVHIDLAPAGKVQTLARVPFANGIARLNDTTIAVASSSTSKILFYDFTGVTTQPTLRLKNEVQVPFLPDNLHTSKHTKVDAKTKVKRTVNALIVSGHAHLPSFSSFCGMRKRCRDDFGRRGCEGTSTTWVQEWRETGTERSGVRQGEEGQEGSSGSAEEGGSSKGKEAQRHQWKSTQSGETRDIYIGNEIDTGSATVWDRNRGVLVIAGLYGKGLLVWEGREEE